MKLFGIGTATIDLRISTADFGPGYLAKLLAQKTEAYGGGSVANALYQATLLGAQTEWLGRLGDDRFGEMILDDLGRHGVGVAHVRRSVGDLSPFNLAVYAGDRRRRVGGFLLPNCLDKIDATDIDAWAAVVGTGDWLLVEVGEIPMDTVLDFCRAVKAEGVTPDAPEQDRREDWPGTGPRIVIDVDLDPIRQCVGGDKKLLLELLGLADVIIPNRDAMSSLYPDRDAPDLAADMYNDVGVPVVVTAGAEGCYVADGDGMTHVPAPLVDVVDTVGAGDAFHGALVATLMTGGSLVAAARRASACGAAACRTFGARSGMPAASKIEQIQEQLREEAP